MARSSAVAAYIAATEVQDEVQRFFSKLFASTQLPPNPYPMLLDHFRRLEPSPAIMSTQEGPTTHVPTTSSSFSFASPASSGQFIARAHMAARLDVDALGRIYAALNASRLVTLYKTTTTDDAYTTTLFVVLVGRTVFAGPLPTMRAPLELQQHIVVQGEKLEKAIAIFVACLAKDVATIAAENALTRGVVVTIPAYKSSDRATEKAWTHERVSASRSAFRSAVKAAVIAKAHIYMCVYAPPTENEHCIRRITKEYILHHDATATVHSFCDDASLVLAQGIFFDPDALRLYVARLGTACPERLQRDCILQAYASHDVFECFQELLLHVLRTPEAPPPPLLESILAVTSQPLLVTLSHIAESVRCILEVLDLTNDVQLVAPMLREIAASVDGLARSRESSFLPPLQSFLTEHVLPIVVHLPDVRDGEYGSAYPRWHSSLYTLLGLVDGVVASLARDIALSERGVAALDHLKMLHTSSLPLPVATEKAATMSFFGIQKKKAASAPAPPTPGLPFASPVDALCVDVVVESEIALAQGRYPRAIATPVTQLQYVVDTRLDAALESALMPIMYEQTLAPRSIYPTLVQRLGAKGACFVLFQATGPELPTAMPLFRPASQLSRDNPMAVQYIDTPAPMAGTRHALALAPALVAATWAWLATVPSFFGVEDTVPSTLFSFSSRAALQADATWLWSHGHVVAFIEHIVVETVERSTAASTKAIERFSDAVLQDVLRLVARSDVLVVALAIGDNKVLGPKDVQSQRDLTRHWIEKAVRALDRIALSLVVDARVVSKAYLLHVAEASASLQAYTTQPLGLSQVFTTVAGAHQVLGSTLRGSEPSTAPSRLETWTAMYAASVETAPEPAMADCIRRCLCSSVVTLATAVGRLEALIAIAVYRTGDALLHLRHYTSIWLNDDVDAVLRAPYLAAYVQPWASAYDGLVTALQANEMHDDVVSRLQRLRGVLLFVSLQWQSAVDGAIAEATARSASHAKCASG